MRAMLFILTSLWQQFIVGCGLLLLTTASQAVGMENAALTYVNHVDNKSIYLNMASLQKQLISQPIATRIELINRFFNTFKTDTDLQVWGRAEFWATPNEFITAMAGDCEDIAVAKYFALINNGINEHALRLAHVKVYNRTHAAIKDHLVLFYFHDTQNPLVLDNLTDEIKPLQQRPDLIHLYSFNRYGIWNSHNQPTTVSSNHSRVLANWRTMLARFDRQ